MCLEQPFGEEKKKKILKEANGEGYKVFVTTKGRLRSAIFKGKLFGENRWLNEKNYRKKGEKFDFIYFWYSEYQLPFYPTGWHIFTTIKGVQNFVDKITPPYSAIRRGKFRKEVIIRKVKFRKVVAVGTELSNPCIVAKEMLVTKEEIKPQLNLNLTEL